MSDTNRLHALSRHINLKAAAAPLSRGLGAPGPQTATISFLKLGDTEGKYPAYTVSVPADVAERLARPGGFRYIKFDSPKNPELTQGLQFLKLD